jgi:polysaccharide export outer membrane protein
MYNLPLLSYLKSAIADLAATAKCRGLITVAVAVCIVAACVTTGEVVKVEVVKEDAYKDLKESERAALEEIRKSSAAKKVDSKLSNVIDKTPQLSVTEYLEKYPETSAWVSKNYRVGGYDVLNIMIYEEEDLSRNGLQVSADGYITYPLIGRLKVDNLTTAEIGKLIASKLAQEQFLLAAHVSVMVADYKSKRVLVLGTVNEPGSYALQARERVLDALSKAGGIWRRTGISGKSSGSAGKKGLIIRTQNPDTPEESKIVININLKGLLEDGDQIANLYMQDKDVLFIPAAENFYIIGQVKEPGSFALTDREITLVEAISRAGGFTPIAARNRARIIRVEKGVEKIITVNVDAITDAGKKIQDVIIQPNDVIVVPESFF